MWEMYKPWYVIWKRNSYTWTSSSDCRESFSYCHWLVSVLLLLTHLSSSSKLSWENIFYFLWRLFVPTDGWPPWCGGGAYGLRGSCRFRFLGIQRGGDLGVPKFGPQNPANGGAKISGYPVQSVCSQGIHYLRACSGVHTGAPGIESDWCIYSIRAVYGCLAVWEPHQWWWTL